MNRTSLLENIVNFSNKSRLRTKKERIKNEILLMNALSVNAPYEGRELILNAFKSGIFPTKGKQGKVLKILTPKQMLQRLPIAFVQVKAGNTSKNLLHEIRRITYSLHQAKEIAKNVCDNIMNSIKV